jgi:myosin-18
VNQLFVSVRGLGVSSALGGSVVGIEGTQSLRRASSIRRTFTTGTAGIKRKSVCLQVKFTVVGVNILLPAFTSVGFVFETL